MLGAQLAENKLIVKLRTQRNFMTEATRAAARTPDLDEPFWNFDMMDRSESVEWRSPKSSVNQVTP